jgi:glycine cleavage system aminomethyltransferase T
LQNADLETDYSLFEAGLARPMIKKVDFLGKTALLAQRQLESQASYLCTLIMVENVDAAGVKRYPVGEWPILETNGEVLVDALGRRSRTTSIAFGPSLGKNIILGYLPVEHAMVGNEFMIEYFCELYLVRVEAVGYQPLLDPQNERQRS